MAQHFTHLHLHTEFSLLDGAIGLDALIDFGKKNSFKALAITDHGNIFAAVKFFQKCKKAGIKPILGMEAYLTPDVTVKSVEKKYYHVILLVQNETGYKNLCKLISFSYQKGFYFKPRIDYNILAKHAEGLIATTACLGGHIPQLLKEGNEKEAEERMDWFTSVFPNRFYFEIQPEEQEEQKVLNQQLYTWSARKNIPLVAAGDCHYLDASDHEAHEVMLSIQTQHKITDPDRFTFGDVRAYVKTQDEMLSLFKDHPEAVWNSGIIADQCNFDFQTDKLYFPKFDIPQ
ncbi:MAG: PHP domain-containing protein [Candidatus Babeliales bacterium]